MAKRVSKPAAEMSADLRIVVLAGKEAMLRTVYTTKLREALEAAHGDIDVLRFGGKESEVAEVLDECRSFGLMTAHKLVIVDEADQWVKEGARALVERYAEAPADAATLVLRTDTWRKGKLDAMIETHGAIVHCEELPAPKAAAWAIGRCKKEHDGELTKAAAAALVERIGSDLGRLDAALGKLALMAGDGEITPELVVREVGLSREEEVWGIQRTLLSGDPEACVAHVREALDVSRHPGVLVVWAMTDLARKLHAASRGGREGTNPQQLAKDLKLWGPARDAVMGAARRVDPERARGLWEACVEADAAGKSGLGKHERHAERLAIRFASVMH